MVTMPSRQICPSDNLGRLWLTNFPPGWLAYRQKHNTRLAGQGGGGSNPHISPQLILYGSIGLLGDSLENNKGGG